MIIAASKATFSTNLSLQKYSQTPEVVKCCKIYVITIMVNTSSFKLQSKVEISASNDQITSRLQTNVFVGSQEIINTELDSVSLSLFWQKSNLASRIYIFLHILVTFEKSNLATNVCAMGQDKVTQDWARSREHGQGRGCWLLLGKVRLGKVLLRYNYNSCQGPLKLTCAPVCS